MKDPALRTALTKVDAKHLTDNETEIDVFACFLTRRLSVVRDPASSSVSDIADMNLQRQIHFLHDCGIELEQISALRQCIDECRNYYENPRFSQNYRPLQGVEELPQEVASRNRLDVVLDGPHDICVGDSKAWGENGAGVWRYVKEQMKQVVPAVRRPAARDGTKGAVKHLGDLYRSLRIVENYLRLRDDGEANSCSAI